MVKKKKNCLVWVWKAWRVLKMSLKSFGKSNAPKL